MPPYNDRHLKLMERAEAIGAGVDATVPEGCGYFLCVWEQKDDGNAVALGNTQPEEARAFIELWFEHRSRGPKA
jgi:hypothetical protein